MVDGSMIKGVSLVWSKAICSPFMYFATGYIVAFSLELAANLKWLFYLSFILG